MSALLAAQNFKVCAKVQKKEQEKKEEGDEGKKKEKKEEKKEEQKSWIIQEIDDKTVSGVCTVLLSPAGDEKKKPAEKKKSAVKVAASELLEGYMVLSSVEKESNCKLSKLSKVSKVVVGQDALLACE